MFRAKGNLLPSPTSNGCNLNIETIKQQIDKIGFIEITIKGNSMDPVLREGQTYFVKKISVKHLKKFQIILFAENDQLISHYIRQIKINQNIEIKTKGINNNYFDKPISPDKIIGVYKEKIQFSLRIKHLAKDFLSGV